MYTKTITPAFEMKANGKRGKLTGYIGELCDETTCVHFKEYSTYHAAEVALDALAFDLMSRNPQAEAEPASTCCFCQKPHHPQDFPEMRALLFAPLRRHLCDNGCGAIATYHAAFSDEPYHGYYCATCGAAGGYILDRFVQPLDLDFAPCGPEV